MKYKAVIFDLFGTLVDVYSRREYESTLTEMASVLTVPSDAFKRLWYETSYERNVGIIPFVEANIKYICKKLGVNIDDEKINLATRVRYEFVANTMKPRQDAIEVLSQLRSQGLKIGLISNCSPEAPIIWEDTPFPPLFDATLFSSSVGSRKPDPRIYQLAVEQLVMKPENCLYIGDGDSQELAGASQAGMYPVLIRVAYEDSTDALRDNADVEEWDGPVISSLKEVLTLVK